MPWPIITVPFLKVDGMAVFPFILVRQKSFERDEVLIRHETIHLKQAVELLVIPFYLLYLFNYLYNRIKYGNHQTSYVNIVFEQEAYSNEHNSAYFKTRKLWAWCRYFNKKTH